MLTGEADTATVPSQVGVFVFLGCQLKSFEYFAYDWRTWAQVRSVERVVVLGVYLTYMLAERWLQQKIYDSFAKNSSC